MATKVQPRPTGTAFTSAAEKRNWDKRYKDSHNTDGTPKAATAKGRRGGIVDPVLPPKIEVAKAAPKRSAAAPKAKTVGGREVKKGKVFVSKEELDAFKNKYGTDKTLTDFLNAERNLTRREDKSKLKPLKTMAEDRKALDEKVAKKKAREEEVKKMVKAAGLAKGGMAKKK